MLKRVLVIVTICLLALGGIVLDDKIIDLQRQLNQIPYSLSSTINRVSPSAVLVEADVNEYGGWSGSGVIVGSHIVLTAKHIIENADDLIITTVDGIVYEAVGRAIDPNNDCGLLFFNEELVPVVEFADTVIVGEQVIIIGSPFGETYFNTTTTGIISGINRCIPFFGEGLMITSDAQANPGNSGGPVFNVWGKLIGIEVGTYSYYRKGTVIVPGSICQKFLKNNLNSD